MTVCTEHADVLLMYGALLPGGQVRIRITRTTEMMTSTTIAYCTSTMRWYVETASERICVSKLCMVHTWKPDNSSSENTDQHSNKHAIIVIPAQRRYVT
jgi:hypothetical protein